MRQVHRVMGGAGRRAALTAAACGMMVTHCAHGQSTWVTISGPSLVTQTTQEIVIDISIGFDYVPSIAEGFTLAVPFIITSDEPQFVDFATVPPLGIGHPPIQPQRIDTWLAQLHLPLQNVYGSQDNPIRACMVWWRPLDYTPKWVTFRAHAGYIDLISDWTTGSPMFRVHDPVPGELRIRVRPEPCYADCDTATGLEVLDIFDFLCIGNRFVVADPYACDCDTATGPGICDIFDFLCFQNAFTAGCD